MKFKIGDKVQYTIVPASGIWIPGTIHDFILGNQGLIGYVIHDCVTGLRHSISEYGVKPYTDGDMDGDVKITVGDKVPDISKLTIKTSLNQYELKPHVKVPVGDETPAIMKYCMSKLDWFDCKVPDISEPRYSIGDKVVVETHMDQYEIGSVIGIVARSGVYIVRVRDNKPGLYKERGYMEKEIKGVTRLENDDRWYFVPKEQYYPHDIIGFRIHKIDGTPEIVKGCVSEQLEEGHYKVRFIENNIIQNTFIEVESKDIIGVKTWYKMVPDFLTKNFNLAKDINNAMNKYEKGEKKEMDYSKCYRENQENQKNRKVNVLPVKVIYHNPATIVFWGDGTKTVVKASSHDEFNEYAGFCAALAKKVYGTSSMVRRIVGEGTDELSGKKVKDIQETPKTPAKKPAAKKTPARKTVKKAPAKKPAAKTEKTEETAK